MPRAKTLQKELERKEKISETCKKVGVGKWMLGKKLSKKTIEKMQARMMGNNWNLGKKQSEKSCTKRSESAKKNGVGRWMSQKVGEMSNNWKGGLPNCLGCDKKLSSYGFTRCVNCSKQFAKGENAPNWRNGISKDLRHYGRERRKREFDAPGTHTENEWTNLKSFYNHICLCCKQQEPFIKLTEDHIVPISVGGSDDISNIQPLCRSCNSIKHTKILDYRAIVLSSGDVY